MPHLLDFSTASRVSDLVFRRILVVRRYCIVIQVMLTVPVIGTVRAYLAAPRKDGGECQTCCLSWRQSGKPSAATCKQEPIRWMRHKRPRSLLGRSIVIRQLASMGNGPSTTSKELYRTQAKCFPGSPSRAWDQGTTAAYESSIAIVCESKLPKLTRLVPCHI